MTCSACALQLMHAKISRPQQKNRNSKMKRKPNPKRTNGKRGVTTFGISFGGSDKDAETRINRPRRNGPLPALIDPIA